MVAFNNSITLRCAVVDSTKRGKRYPDALAKTIPIWCAVMNRWIKITRELSDDWDCQLYTLPSVISRQEHEQIELILDGFVQLIMVRIGVEKIGI